MTKRVIIIFIVAVLFFGSGFITAKIVYRPEPVDPANTRAAGWEAARQRLFDLGIVQKDEAEASITEISGDIIKVEPSAITIRIRPLEPLADPNLDSRLIRVDGNTKITQNTVKDAEKFQEEMKAYREEVADNYDRLVNTDDFPPPPSSYAETEVTSSALAVNQRIRITAGDNIRGKKEFAARAITILP